MFGKESTNQAIWLDENEFCDDSKDNTHRISSTRRHSSWIFGEISINPGKLSNFELYESIEIINGQVTYTYCQNLLPKTTALSYTGYDSQFLSWGFIHILELSHGMSHTVFRTFYLIPMKDKS